MTERKLAAGLTVEQIIAVSALPGFSEHHTGRAIDIGTPGCAPVTDGIEQRDRFLERFPKTRASRSTKLMNVKIIADLVGRKSEKQPKFFDDAALGSLAEFLEQPDIADYLRNCLPVELLGASDVRLLPLDAIEQEMAEGAAPGSFIRPYGYLVIASSIGGNAVCFHSPSGKVFWADHVSFASDCISFKDRTTSQWKYLYEYNPENIEKALVPLADNIESFLKDLLADRLTKQLEALD